MSKPKVFQGDFGPIDPLEQCATVEVPCDKLRPGMVVCDRDLGTPGAALDQRLRATRNSGSKSFMGWDLDTNTYRRYDFGPNRTFAVMAV